MLESLNGGKPIKESRDVDLPLAAAHFFYYAGWADKLEYAFPNRRPRPVGVAGQIIPWNFPLLMLAWKIAPALAAGNTVVLKPAETTPLTALLFCDVLRQAELPPGVVNIVTGDGRTGAALVEHPDVDKIAFTGSTEVGKAIQRELAGTRQGADARARRQGREHRLRRRAARPGGRGDRQRHLLQPGPRLLRRLAAARAGVDPAAADREAQAPARDAARRRPARQEHRRRRDQLGRAAAADRGARRRRRAGGRRDLPAAVPAARAGLLVRADRVHRTSRRATGSRRRRSSARCSPCSRSARRRRRSRRRTTPPTGCRPASGRRRARASCGWRSGCAPASCGRTRSTASTRRRRSAATRSRASAARAACTGSSRTCASTGRDGVGRMTRVPVSKTYKLYVGGAFPRSESGPHLRGRGAQHRAGVAQGPARRGPGRARRARRSGRG